MSSERSGEGISTCLCWFHHLWISFRFDEREDRTVTKPKTESPLLHLAVTTHHSIDPAEITGTLLIRLVGLDYNQAIAELMLILIFPAREKKLLIKKPITRNPSEMHWLVEEILWRVENRSVHTLPYEKATGVSEHQTTTKFRKTRIKLFIRQDNISNTHIIIPLSNLISIQYFKFKAKLCTAQ